MTDLIYLNREFAVITVGNKVLILRERTDPISGHRRQVLLSKSDFETLVADRPPPTGARSSLAKAWVAYPGRRAYAGFVFDPSLPPEPEHGREARGNEFYNLWQGLSVDPAEGDCSRYLEHVRENICGGNQTHYSYVLAWMADAVQNPARRPGTAIVLRGKQGVGKGVFVQVFGSLFGPHFKHIHSARHLTGNFNAHLKDALVVFADEAFWAGDKAGEGVLKGLITEATFQIEMKHKDAFQIRNYVRLMVASNHDWVVPAGAEERRFFVLDVADTHMQDHAYFAQIEEEMDNGGRAALLHFLMNYDRNGVNLRQIPRTNALLDQKLHTMEPIPRWWFDRLWAGAVVRLHDEWRQSVPKNSVYDDFIEHARQVGVNRRAAESTIGKELRDLVPGLREARPTIDYMRRRTYELPTLVECRTAFESVIGHTVEWPEELEEEDCDLLDD